MLIACYGFIPAGFPSPAGDCMEDAIDLNAHIIDHPSATFYFRADGESMVGAHIPPKALLAVDRSLRPKDGSIIVAVVNDKYGKNVFIFFTKFWNTLAFHVPFSLQSSICFKQLKYQVHLKPIIREN